MTTDTTETPEPDPVPRSIEMQIEVPGSVEEVWQAIATGPGISSWYVPHRVEEREGGAATASFGPGPEMQVDGKVAAWEPPHRVVFSGETEGEGLAFEWLVEAKEGGTCIVRLVNSGFGDGGEWDAQYDAMTEGWAIFLTNLRLHLEYFAPEPATAMLPTAMWPIDAASAWKALTDRLGVPNDADGGDRITVHDSSGAPPMSGLVVQATPTRYTLLIDTPASGTGFVAAEGHGDQTMVSVWLYLYGAEGASAAERDDPLWRAWFEDGGPSA